MESLTPDEHEVLEAILLLKHPVSFEEITTNEAKDEEEEEALDENQHKRMKIGKNQVKVSRKINKKQHNKVEIDDSKQTLRCMLNYKDNTPDYPSEKLFIHDPDAVEVCSKPIRKQLTKSDVDINLCRLMLGKEHVEKMMFDVLRETLELDTEGFNVSVYGPDGKIYDMMFKKWKLTPVLASRTWMEFVKTNNLDKYCSFLTIWMFKHIRTQKVCFAIDCTTFPISKKLSNRIMKAAAFKNPT